MFRNEERQVTLTPLAGSKVIINGNAVTETTELQHLVGLNSYTNIMMCVTAHTHKLTQTHTSFLSPYRTV